MMASVMAIQSQTFMGNLLCFFVLIGLHQLWDQVGLSKMDSLKLLVDCQGPVLHQPKVDEAQLED